ncbi:MAG TPA: J domain-containing protein [Dehalococcoidia bacterium]|jgi:molecular chaperone DnaJ|nr:J domain-containing protein [Dehalococcoidia bacterium]
MANDLYRVLGVRRDASDKDIRSAYRKLARQFHPDVNPGNVEAESRFKEINAAYDVLSDSDSRRKYNRYGDQWQHADQFEQAGGRGSPFGGGGAQFGGSPFGGGGDPSGAFGGGIFDSLFRRAAGQQKGADAEHTVRLTLEEAYRGSSRTIEVREGSETCQICGGAGELAGATCHACRGSGNAAPVRRIEVTVPAGVQDGTRIRVAGRGGSGSNGGPPGDLYLRVTLRPHANFERRADDLHCDIDVPVEEAALGGEVRVPSLRGKTLALRIPAGTQSGKSFRLAGQGMPRKGGGFGDLHVRVLLTLPDPMSDEQRALFEQLRAGKSGATSETSETGAPA